MKGLVRKDLKLLAKMDNRIFVIVLYAFAISIAYFGNADIYALQSTLFFSLFLGMHLMMTLTYDGMSSWKEYEMTLPLSVKQIVGSKYLSCLAVLPVSLIGTIVIYLIRWIVYHTFPADLFRISMMFAVIMPLLWCSSSVVFSLFSPGTVDRVHEYSVCKNHGYDACPLPATRFKKH